MAIWPFGRRRKKGDGKDETETVKGRESARDIRGQSKLHKASSRSDRKSRERSTSKISSRTQDSRSREIEKRESLPPVPPLPSAKTASPNQFAEKKIAVQEQSGGPSRQPLAELYNPEGVPPSFFQNSNVASQTSIQPEKFHATPIPQTVPTLRAKRSSAQEGDLPRKKSSKRRSGAKEREEEIKSMSASSPIPIPKRPQSFAGGVLARDNKRVPGGLNRHLDRPPSEISLPQAESIRSSVSGMSDYHSFRVGAFDALSPRPTIRTTESVRHTFSGLYCGTRSPARKDKGPAIPEEDFNSRARIRDLADDLDASGLKELMDRDRRRRERKKKSDHERLQRKLQRSSEKQQAEDHKATKERQANEAAEKGLGIQDDPFIMGQDEGFGIREAREEQQGGSSPARASREAAASPSSWLQDPSKEDLPSPNVDPFVDPMSESRLDLGTPSEKDEPVIETAKAVRLSSASMSPPLQPDQAHGSVAANLVDPPPSVPEQESNTPSTVEPQRPEKLLPPEPWRVSDSSSRKAASWTSFFRRGRKDSFGSEKKQPTEFSNTSRESFSRQQKSPPAVVPRSFKRNTDGTPQRTQSKFREDLPEIPASTPVSSRPYSPEMPAASSPFIDHASKVSTMDDETRAITPLGDVHPVFRDAMASRQQSMRSPSPEGPASAMLSQSLASVDSEGSWLSGRTPKRSSIPINQARGSQSSLTQKMREEDNSISEEPYFARQDPHERGSRGPGGLTSQLQSIDTRPVEGDDESVDPPATVSPLEESVKLDTVVGKRPNIVSQSAAARSREGLLDEFAASEAVSPISRDDPSPSSPESPENERRQGLEEESSIQRATSVEYRTKGHVRHVSAGSARLLDIAPRMSNEQKRRSQLSASERSPLAGGSFGESMNEEDTHPHTMPSDEKEITDETSTTGGTKESEQATEVTNNSG